MALRDGRTGDALGQDLKMFMEREEGRKKLSDMFRDVEDRRTASNAASPSDARRMSQEAQARRYSEGFSPDQQRAAYDAKMLDLHVQDQETIKRTLDDKRQAVLLQRQEIEAARVGGLAGQIIAAKARELNEIRASERKLTQAEVEARLKLAELSVVQGETLRRTQEQADGYINIWTTAANSVGGAIDDVFQKVLDGQEVKIEDLLKRIASQVGSAIIQETITRPLTNIFRQFAESARGGVAVPSLGATASPLGPVAGGAMSGVQAANQNFAGMAQRCRLLRPE